MCESHRQSVGTGAKHAGNTRTGQESPCGSNRTRVWESVMTEPVKEPVSRRSLLSMIGVLAGSAAMYNAMTELGYAEGSTFKGPIKLSPPPPGTSVLILGAGVAGMVAAMELRDAGYKVQVLEYNGRPGGRHWSLYGGDTFTELGGFSQHVALHPGQYIHPGPRRLPY